MANANNEFQIVGRYLDGKTVTAYHLQSLGSGKAGRYTKEQVAYLIGKELITNCTAQIYKGKLLLRGKGMSLDDLPAQQENGELKNTDNIGKVKKGTTAGDAMEQLMIVGALKSGRKTVGYIAQNAGCGTIRLSRKKVIELAAAGKIGNARVQNYNGNQLLRGVGINLDSLPSEEVVVDEVKQAQNTSNTSNTNNKNTGSAGISETKMMLRTDASSKLGAIVCNSINNALRKDTAKATSIFGEGLSANIISDIEFRANDFKAIENDGQLGAKYEDAHNILGCMLDGNSITSRDEDQISRVDMWYNSTLDDAILSASNSNKVILGIHQLVMRTTSGVEINISLAVIADKNKTRTKSNSLFGDGAQQEYVESYKQTYILNIMGDPNIVDYTSGFNSMAIKGSRNGNPFTINSSTIGFSSMENQFLQIVEKIIQMSI